MYKCTTYIIVVMILKNVFVVDFGMHTYPCRLSTRSRYGSVCYVKKKCTPYTRTYTNYRKGSTLSDRHMITYRVPSLYGFLGLNFPRVHSVVYRIQ